MRAYWLSSCCHRASFFGTGEQLFARAGDRADSNKLKDSTTVRDLKSGLPYPRMRSLFEDRPACFELKRHLQRAALGGTFSCHLEKFGDAIAVFRRDGEFGGSQQRV